MSASFAICLALLTLGSCFASYRIGMSEERARWMERQRKFHDRRRRLEDLEEEE